MKKLLSIAIILIATAALAQTWIPQTYVNADVNQSATPKVVTITINGSKVSAGAGAPAANCAKGDAYLRNDGGVGSTLYGCTATNTWTAFLTTGGVSLQGSTPGSADTGNVNVSGAIIAGTSVAAGTAVTAGTSVTATTSVTGATIVSGASVWSSGAGAPSANCAIGDLYSRTDGSTSTTLYVCTATNTWTAK